MKISDLLKRSPVVALFLWVLLVSSTVLSLSEAKNPTKLQMTNSLNFQPPLKNLVKSQHQQLLQLQQDQNNIIYNKDDTNQLLNQVSVSASSTRKTEISTTRKNQHQRNHQNSKYSNHNRNRSNRNRKNKQHNTNQLRSQTKMDCTVNPDPIWIRNDCTDGFLAIISDRRVVTLNSRVDQHDNLVQLRSESCTSRNASLWEPVRTRLFSESQNRYICFNRRGRLRSVPKRRARRLGNLCAFYERALASERHMKYSSGASEGDATPTIIPTTHFNLQSAHNPRWYMGFLKPGLKHIGLRYSPQGHALSLPRRMGRPAPHDKIVRPRTKCDFRFYSGIFTPTQPPKATPLSGDATPSGASVTPSRASNPSLSGMDPWAGMLEKIELHHNENSVRTSDKRADGNGVQSKFLDLPSSLDNFQQGAFNRKNRKAVQHHRRTRPHHQKGQKNHQKKGPKGPKYLSTRISRPKNHHQNQNLLY